MTPLELPIYQPVKGDRLALYSGIDKTHYTTFLVKEIFTVPDGTKLVVVDVYCKDCDRNGEGPDLQTWEDEIELENWIEMFSDSLFFPEVLSMSKSMRLEYRN